MWEGSARERPPARPEPLAGDFQRSPSPIRRRGVKHAGPSLENEDWDHDSEDHDEDHPDPGKIKYWDILCTIFCIIYKIASNSEQY